MQLLASSRAPVTTSRITEAASRPCRVQHLNAITNRREEHAGITSTAISEVLSLFSLTAQYSTGSNAPQQIPWSPGTGEDSLLIRSGSLRFYLYCLKNRLRGTFCISTINAALSLLPRQAGEPADLALPTQHWKNNSCNCTQNFALGRPLDDRVFNICSHCIYSFVTVLFKSERVLTPVATVGGHADPNLVN